MNADFINKIIFGKYKVLKPLDKGSFGSVYKAKNIRTNELVAIKAEDWKLCGNILENEAFILYILQNFGIPELKSFGVYKKKYKVLVQTLLGYNLQNLISNYKKRLNMKDICMIAIQLLDRLEFIHSKYIIHRDLKPENVMIDLDTKKIIYLIDFGMAKKYRSSKTKKHIKFTIPFRLTGTARYCSVNALRGTEQSRRDDLESAGYVLIYIAQKGYLPWMGLNIQDKLARYKKIYHIKKCLKEEDLCRKLPEQFCKYMKYTKKLNFEEDPNYNYLRGLFIELLISLNFKNDLEFSWLSKCNDNYGEDLYAKKVSKALNRRKGSLQGRILKNIQNIMGKEIKLDNNNQDKSINTIETDQEKIENEIIEKNEKKEALIFSPENKSNKIIQDTPSFNDVKKEENKSENITQIAYLNMEIIIEDSDDANKKNEKEINSNNLNNKIKEEKINDNKNEQRENINIINVKLEKKFESKENNVFNLDNYSFKGKERLEPLKQSKNKIFNKNERETRNKIIKIQKNKDSNLKELNTDYTIKKNYITNLKQNITKENYNNSINNSRTNINKNKAKIIKIISNELNSESNSQNKNKSIPKFINRNDIHNITIKRMIHGKENNLKKNNLCKNINLNITDNSLIKNPKRKNKFIINNNSNNINKSGSGKSINLLDIDIKPIFSRRNVINYNEVNISKSNSSRKIIRNRIPDDKIFPNYNKISTNSNYSKESNFVQNSGKESYISTIFSDSGYQSKKLNKIKVLIPPEVSNKQKLLKYNSIKNPTKKGIKNNIQETNIFPFNFDNYNQKSNNNYINNIHCSINNYLYNKSDIGQNNAFNYYKNPTLSPNTSKRIIDPFYETLKKIKIHRNHYISPINHIHSSINIRKNYLPKQNNSYIKYNKLNTTNINKSNDNNQV